jgi:hypothetical protein
LSWRTFFREFATEEQQRGGKTIDFFLSQEVQPNETTKERKNSLKSKGKEKASEERRKKSREINNKSFEKDTFLRIWVPFAFIFFIIMELRS